MATWSGHWERDFGENYSLLIDKNPLRKRLARVMRRKSNLVLGEVLTTALADSTPASTASVSRKRVDAGTADPGNPTVNGGKRVIENESLINRAITSADIADINLLIAGGSEAKTAPATYAVDKSGNGGAGKVGSF